MARFFGGLMGFGMGLACVIFSGSLVSFFGKIPWAERNIGSTRGMYVLIGSGVMFLSVLYMFGVFSLGGNLVDTTGLE